MPTTCYPRRPSPLDWLTLVLWLAFPALCLSADTLTAEIWNLLDAGKGREAYQMAAERLPRDSPERDLLLGIAAAQAGDAREAVTRLKRHLEAFPAHRQNPRAQLELGRAYFRLGQLNAAQAQFESVLAEEPPQAVADNLQQALAVIALERNALKPRLGAFVEVGFGYDSNINSGVQDPDMTLPILGEIRLVPEAVAQHAGMGSLVAGMEVHRALRRDLGLFAAARADLRMHDNYADLDQQSLSLNAGVSKTIDQLLVRAALGWSVMQLDWNTYRDSYTGTLELSRQLGERTALGAYGQAGEIGYRGNNRSRDAQLYVVGLAFSRALEGAWKPLLRISPSYSMEVNKRGFKALSRNLPGMRIGLELQLAERWDLGAQFTWQQAEHRAVGDLNVQRKDEYNAFEVSVTHKIDGRWSVRAEAQYARNDSNLVLYEYNRTGVMLKARRDFR